MSVVTYRHPETKDIKQVDPSNDVQVAAVKKLGYVEITGKDIANEESLTVTYEQVTRPNAPKEPPALPKLTKAVKPAPTRDTSETVEAGTVKTAAGNTLETEDAERKNTAPTSTPFVAPATARPSGWDDDEDAKPLPKFDKK